MEPHAGHGADQPSNFDRAWQAGLREFFAGNYAAAEKPLADADRLLPELPDVKRITAENFAKIKHPPPRPVPWAPGAIGVTVVSLGVYGSLWLARWRRNQFRVRPSEVAKLIESSPQPPIILDVRDRRHTTTAPCVSPTRATLHWISSTLAWRP